MESPYAPRRRRQGDEPAPKSSFQRELDAKMRDRRGRGLATEVTESEDELGSDDELMAHFNMTNKPQPSPRGDPGEDRKSPWVPPGMNKTDEQKKRSPRDDIGHQGNRRSPYEDGVPYGSRRSSQDDRLPATINSKRSAFDDSRQSPFDPSVRRSPANKAGSPADGVFGKKIQDGAAADMLKTLRRPGGWKSPAASSRTSPAAQPRRIRYGSDDEISDGDSDEIESVSQQRNRPMSAMRHHRDTHPDEDKENRNRTKSPGVRGRKTPTMRDSLDEQEDRLPLTPRSRSSSRVGLGRDAEPSRPRPKPRAGKEANQDADRDASWARLTSTHTTGGEKSRSGMPQNDGSGRKTPTERRKSPFNSEIKPGKRSNLHSDPESDDERSSPFKPVPRGRKGSLQHSKDEQKGRKSPFTDKVKSQNELNSNRKSPLGEKKFGRRTPSRDVDSDEEGGTQGRSVADRKSPATNRKSPFGFKTGKHDGKETRSDHGSLGRVDDDVDDYNSKNRRGRRSPWDTDRRADDMRPDDKRDRRADDRWEGDRRADDRRADDRRATGRKSPWEAELNQKKDKCADKDGTRRKSLIRDDNGDDISDDGKHRQSSDRRSPWEKDARRDYKDGKYLDNDDDWRRDRKREEPEDRSVHWASRDRPPSLRRSPAVGPDDDDRRRSNRRQDALHGDRFDADSAGSDDDRDPRARRRANDDDDYHRRHYVDGDDKYSSHYDYKNGDRYERDRGDGRYPRHHGDRDDGRHPRRRDSSDDERDERGTHEGDKKRKGKRRSSGPAADEEPSSVCGDMDIDPTLKLPQTKEGKEIEKRQPRHQRKEKQVLDEVINSVKDAQQRGITATEQKMRYIDPAGKPAEKAPQSSRTPRVKPKPRYARPGSATVSTANFDNTLDIRDSVYQQWYAERMEAAHRQKQERQRAEKEEEDRKKKEKEEKYYGAKASYNSWLENKKSVIPEKQKKKEMEAKNKKEEEEKRQKKIKDADVTFRLWKQEKDITLKEKARAKRKEEEGKLKEKQDKEIEKRKDAEKVFKGWKSAKDEVLIEKASKVQEEEQRKVKLENRQKRKRERLAMSSYDQWLDKKETQQINTQSFDDEDNWKPAWRPNSSTVMFGR